MHSEDTTTGTLLGGRIVYTQPAHGFRSGIEPVFLAASIPARPGQRVLEAGTGAGAGLLCLAARVPRISGLGVECDPVMADLAERNFAANGCAGLLATCADITRFQASTPFDHACANPPYHTETGAASSILRRKLSKHADAGTIATWITALARNVRHHGTISLILPATRLDQALAAFSAAHCGAVQIRPLWPHTNKEAKLTILQASRGKRSPLRLLPGIVLHQEPVGFTDAARAVLEDACALD